MCKKNNREISVIREIRCVRKVTTPFLHKKMWATSKSPTHYYIIYVLSIIPYYLISVSLD